MKRIIIIVGVSIIVLVGGTISALVIYQDIANNHEQKVTNNPTFATIIPKSTSISWDRISPPGNDPVYAYPDTLAGVPISVSEQPLPRSLKTNTDEQITTLAKSYNATTLIKADNTKVYIGTSTQGPQSVIFTKDNLLVLIKSQKKISNDAWKNYISGLR